MDNKDLIIDKQAELIKTYEAYNEDLSEYEFYLWDTEIRKLHKELSRLKEKEEEQPYTPVLARIHEALKQGRRLEAIKIHFESTQSKSLKESKNFVDNIWIQNYK
jgi:hypothetical protein